MQYERQVLAVDDEGRIDCDGDIVALLEAPKAGRNQITALVAVPETELAAKAPTTFSDDSEGVASDEKPTCAGKSGECSRTVDEDGDRCWQHE